MIKGYQTKSWLLTNQDTPDKGKEVSQHNIFKRCLLASYDNHEWVSSRSPKNCCNTQKNFSAFQLKAYPKYIFSGFELPSKHINTILVPSMLCNPFWSGEWVVSHINNYTKIMTKDIKQIQFSTPSNTNSMAWNTQKSHRIILIIISSHCSTAWTSIACLP